VVTIRLDVFTVEFGFPFTNATVSSWASATGWV
jgi:hypothetical protein